MKTKKTDPEATKTAPAPAEGDSGRLSTALELLRTILETGTTNQNRPLLRYCKAAMAMPLELHRKECVWRRAWELVNRK
jgi:hypothetical protein